MSLSETIECLVRDGYKIKFESQSRFLMTIILSNGRVFSCWDIHTSMMDDEDLRKTLEYMKEEVDRSDAEYRKEKMMAIVWHPCRYIDLTLEHDGSWIDGRWYEWEDIHGNREIARMKLDAIDHFYPQTKIIKEEDVCRYREIEEGVKDD